MVAERTGLAAWTVGEERRRRGIAPYRSRREPIQWTPEMVAALGTDSDAQTGRSLRALGKRRRLLGVIRAWRYGWSESALARLGREPDAVIAADIGIPPALVTKKRGALGILFRPSRGRRDS